MNYLENAKKALDASSDKLSKADCGDGEEET